MSFICSDQFSIENGVVADENCFTSMARLTSCYTAALVFVSHRVSAPLWIETSGVLSISLYFSKCNETQKYRTQASEMNLFQDIEL